MATSSSLSTSNQNFLDRIRSECDPTQQITTDLQWITKNTTIKNLPFSTKHHEYQEILLNSPYRKKYCRKCSQLGVSEAAVRRMLSKACRIAGVTGLYALPTAKFSNKFGATRVQAAIDSASAAKEALYKNDSNEVRQFINGSFIYMQGCSSSSQVISIPVDFLTVDEKDIAEDQTLVSSLNSRLTHSSYKDQFHFSTPTVSGYGISLDYESSLQHVEIQKCCHCNHFFVPDYYENVALPGFNRPTSSHSSYQGQANANSSANSSANPSFIGKGADKFAKEVATRLGFSEQQAELISTSDAILTLAKSPFDRTLREFTHSSRQLLRAFKIDSAYLECPKCRKPVDTSLKYREWIRVNESEFSDPNHIDTPVAYQISPFSAPPYIDPSSGLPTGRSMGSLIIDSTNYVDVKDFTNYALGLPFDDASTGLSEQEIRDLFNNPTTDPTLPDSVPLYPTLPEQAPYLVCGMDLGGTCARLLAYPAPDGHLRILKAQRVPLHQVKDTHLLQIPQLRVISSVLDAMPYTETVSSLQSKDERMFACIFSASKSLELFQVREQETDEDKAMFGLRQLTASRDKLLDYVVALIREGKISFAPSTYPEMEDIVKHLRGPKRIKRERSTPQNPKGVYTWQKPQDGEDHYFLALAYLVLANFIKGLHNNASPLPLLATKFKVTNNGL